MTQRCRAVNEQSCCSILRDEGFTPSPADVFTIVNFSFISGSFANVAIGGRVYIDGSYSSFELQHVGNSLRLANYQAGEPTYNRWTQLSGLTGADADPLANPIGDGIANLLKYALGLNPTRPELSGITVHTTEVGGITYLALSYTRPAGSAARSDVSYSVARASILTTETHWSTSNVVTHSITPGPSEAEMVTVRSTIPMSGQGHEFLRLSVSLN